MWTLKYCVYAVKPTKDTTTIPNLECGSLSDLSGESRRVCVGDDNLGVETIDVKDIEMASVFTQANYMCNEWLMNHY